MKRLIVPVLGLGLAFVLANTASAGLLDKLHHRGCCDPCKPACPAPACEPCCAKPACDPCDPCARPHLGRKMLGWVKSLCHKDRCCDPCDPCGGAALPAAAPEAHPGHTMYEPATAPRLRPIPTTGMRSSSRFFSR